MSANNGEDKRLRPLSLVRTGNYGHSLTHNGDSDARDVTIIPLSSEMTEEPKKTLQGKVALIAGGANVEGLELACSLAQRGADVTVIDVKGNEQMGARIESAVQARGQRSLIILAQAVGEESEPTFAQDSIAKIVAMFGRLDIFIDLSGQSTGADKNLASTRDSEQLLREQLFPSFNLMRAALDEIVD